MKGLNVVLFESRHAKTMCDLVRLQGGVPFSAPALKEVPFSENPKAFEFGERLLRGKFDVVIFLTGVGARYLLSILETKFKKEDMLNALRKTIIVPRGPKPIRALNEWGVPYAVTVPEPNTWHEILRTFDENISAIPLRGKKVALQEYGVPNPELIEGLRQRGADLFIMPVYRWALPDDTAPLRSAIENITQGGMDVAVFTTSVQADHVFKVAAEMRLATELKEAFGRMVVASIGPDSSQTLRSLGLGVDIEPENSKMGPLVLEVAKKAAGILEEKKQKGFSTMIETVGPDVGAIHESPLRGDIATCHNSAFLKACRLEKTPFTPVWLMRQAGRYMKEYRQIRNKTPFLEICKNKELVTEITLGAQERIKADAAIIFSDILLIVEAFGFRLDYVKGDGPWIDNPVRDRKAVERLPEVSVKEGLDYLFDAIRLTRKSLAPAIPLIGFAGAPFTVASYMIEGGATKDFSQTKRFMLSESAAWGSLMKKIARATVQSLNAQIQAGVQAVQLFDSWVGNLSADEYEKYALPYSAEVILGVGRGAPTPLIHFGTGARHLLELMARAGGEVIGVDHRVRLDEAWARIGHDKAIQGNLDPLVLCSSIQNIKSHVKQILKYADGRPGHIFNLGHGVLPDTPVENVVALVEMVHEFSRK